MQYQPFSPVDIRFSSLQEFAEELSVFADKRVLILADGVMLSLLEKHPGFVALVKDKKSRLISDIRPNPSVDDIRRHLNTLRTEGKFDNIIAVGGGSCIDLAKAISALHGLAVKKELSYADIVDAIMNKTYLQGYDSIDIIAVPTTAGTGSEVTKWATVWDFSAKKKLSIDNTACFPKVAYMIPELTISMPQRLTLSTGLDAMSHAMEAFWAGKRTPLSQALAFASVGRVKKSLPIVLEKPDNLEARTDMCTGSLLAGLAFSITRTTACHSISYPLTMNHGIEHGFAAALTLSQMMEINAKAVPEMEEIASIFDGDGGLNRWMTDVSRGIQELKLSAFGIHEHMIDSIANGAFTLGRMDNNPILLEPESVKEILKNIL